MRKHPWQSPLLPALGILLLLVGCNPAGSIAVAPPALTPRSIAQLAENALPPILRFGQVQDPLHPERQIYRGGRPSDADLQRLAARGIKTIVSLEDAEDQGMEAADVAYERDVANRLSMTFINLPIPDGGAPSAWIIERFISLASESERDPVFVHCVWGRDRTGAVLAAYRIHEDNYTAEQALTEMKSFGYEPAMYPALENFVHDYAVRGD